MELNSQIPGPSDFHQGFLPVGDGPQLSAMSVSVWSRYLSPEQWIFHSSFWEIVVLRMSTKRMSSLPGRTCGIRSVCTIQKLSRNRQTWRGDQRLSTTASFNEDCGGEKQGLISGLGHCIQFQLQNRGIWGSDRQVQVVVDCRNKVKEFERKPSFFKKQNTYNLFTWEIIFLSCLISWSHFCSLWNPSPGWNTQDNMDGRILLFLPKMRNMHSPCYS